ncbi:MAG: alpha-2-macroglobulin family protein [Thermodesulfobacteriota bacterium]
MLWEGPEGNVLSIVPEKKSYKVGETARFLVQNPFEKAEALITVERLGVISQKTVTWTTSTPVVEVPVTPNLIPGFYLSVVAFSPRVDKPLSDTGVDLGKPNFRIGYQSITVKDPYKEIVVTAVPDKKKAKPREKVTVKLHAVPRHPDGKEPVELAVAVLDEAVFDLVQGGEKAFDPYDGFYRLEDLDLLNYNLLYRLVGRTKFEKKGKSQGGDGAGLEISMRTIFKYVCFWNPRVATDKDGNATIAFTLPDNLTSFRVLAMATTPDDRMGLGQADVAVSLPTEVRPVMPNQVMEKDSFEAGFSIANRTDKERELTVSITASGPLAAPVSAEKQIKLAPYARSTVFLPVKTKTFGEITFIAKAWDETDGDGVTVKVPVLKMRSLITGATYGSFTQGSVTEKIAFPKDIWPDVGKAGAVLSPSVIGGLGGAFAYLRDYPYLCWEQRLTKGVMASHYMNLRPYLPEDFTWPGADTLTGTMLNDAASFQAENGGMCYYVPRNEYVSPYLSAYTALAFAWLARAGHPVPAQVEARLQAYLTVLLKRDEMPSYFSRGMSDTVRAVALAALALRGKLPPGEVARYRPHLAYMSLFGKAHYLIAAVATNAPEDLVAEAANAILAHADQSGGKFQFVESLDDGYARILASPLRTNGAILSAMLALSEKPFGKKLCGDVPEKLMIFITQSRKNRDHWENTQENMFCLNGVVDYARLYENTTPDCRITATLDQKPLGTATFTSFRDPARDLFRPVSHKDPGTLQSLILSKDGPGRVYYSARLTYAPKTGFDKPRNDGIEIHREYSVERNGTFTLLKSPMKISRGELVRVDLYIKIPGARNFVVVDDPVPGGLEPVNRDLATASNVDASKGDYQRAGGSFWFNANDWFEFGASRWCFYHQELGFDAARFYSEYLPPGNYHLSYTAQAIAAGDFAVMPAGAEEMYNPDVFGKTTAAELIVAEKAK